MKIILRSLLLLRRVARLFQIDAADARYGFYSALTMWLAFVLASFLHVQNAYWAAMAAWIVMQPTRGILLERGFYRLIGTVLGAGAGFAILHWIHQIHVAVWVLALWMALCAALTHLFRRVTAYGAMLAGITPVVVVMPTLHAGDQTLELAMARVVCTLIGVLVATLVGFLLVPRSPLPDFIARLRCLVADAVDFSAQELSGISANASRRRANELVAEMAGLEQAMLINTAGSRNGPRRTHHFSAFVGCALALMAAVQLAARRTVPVALCPALKALASYLRHPPQRQDTQIIDTALVSAREFDPRLAQAFADLLQAEADVLGGQSELASQRYRSKAISHDKDWHTAGYSALATFLAVGCAGSVAMLVSWKFAPLVALGIGNFVMLLSSMERPHLMVGKIFQGVCAGVAAAMLFRILLLPLVHSTFGVVLLVIPFVLLGGVLRASKMTAILSVDYVMCFMLAGQPFLAPYRPWGLIFQEGSALVLGTALVGLGHLLLPRDPGLRVRNISRLIVRDLQRMADLARDPGERWQAMMTHRLLRLTVHLGRMDNLHHHGAQEVLAALNLGHAILRLRTVLARDDLSEAQRLALESIVLALGKLGDEPVALLGLLQSTLSGFDAPETRLANNTGHAEARDALKDVQFSLQCGTNLLVRAPAG